MNPAFDEPPPRPPRTTLFAVLGLAAACGLVWLFVLWRESGPRSASAWAYPRAVELSSIRRPRVLVREAETSNPFSVVSAYYDDRAKIRGGDPCFMNRGGMFGPSSFVLKHSFSSRGAMPGALQANWNKREFAFIQYWAAASNSAARVVVSAIHFGIPDDWSGWSTPQALQDLAYPGAMNRSSGSAGWLASTLHHSPDSLDAVWSHYLKRLPGGSNVLSAGADVVFTNSIRRASLGQPAELILLPVTPMPGLDHRALLQFWGNRLMLVWVWRPAGDKETQILQAIAVRE